MKIFVGKNIRRYFRHLTKISSLFADEVFTDKVPRLIHRVPNQYEVSLQIQNTVLDFRVSTYTPRFTVIRSALYSRRTAKMLKKKNIGRDVTDFHENPPPPPYFTVTHRH